MAQVKIKRDTTLYDRRRREWKHLIDFYIEVGWDGVMHSSGVSAARLVQWLEEGHVNKGWFKGTTTAPRPFIRNHFMPRAKKITDEMVPKYLHRIFENPKENMMAHHLKSLLEKEMRGAIKDYNDVPNTPTTTELKGKNDPLVDSGFLMENVKSEIVPTKSKYLQNKEKNKKG